MPRTLPISVMDEPRPALPSEVALCRIGEIERDVLYRLFVADRRDLALAAAHWDAPRREYFLRMQYQAQQQQYESLFPDARLDVIVFGGVPIGRFFVAPLECEIRLVDVMLLPRYRGRGLARGLLEGLFDEARRSNKPVTLSVQSDNPARRLYARLGFRETDETGFHRRMEWTPPGTAIR